MPGFGDSAFIILLALLLFGPKKLPVLARQLGKLMADFRRASNEFRTQMEEELRISEQADRQKKIAAAESAATGGAVATAAVVEPELLPPPPELQYSPEEPMGSTVGESVSAADEESMVSEAEVAPIAVSGELSILPPATGLPVANTGHGGEQNGAGQMTELMNEGAGAGHEGVGVHHEGAEHGGVLETETLHG
jgi:sec-independent protein translocase protein TatB